MHEIVKDADESKIFFVEHLNMCVMQYLVCEERGRNLKIVLTFGTQS